MNLDNVKVHIDIPLGWSVEVPALTVDGKDFLDRAQILKVVMKRHTELKEVNYYKKSYEVKKVNYRISKWTINKEWYDISGDVYLVKDWTD